MNGPKYEYPHTLFPLYVKADAYIRVRLCDYMCKAVRIYV